MTVEFDRFILAGATDELAVEARARGTADALEFRMDLAEDPLAQLEAYNGELALIATNRIENEGGAVPEGETRRATLRSAIDDEAVAAVDLELSAVAAGDVDALRDRAAATDTAVIVSAHEFDGTPTRDAMAETLRRAAEAGDVGKLAVRATTMEDVLDLLVVTLERTRAGDRVATVAMGPIGRHSRAVTPLYGSKIGYAPVDAEDATAPGQYDLETLASLVRALRGDNEDV